MVFLTVDGGNVVTAVDCGVVMIYVVVWLKMEAEVVEDGGFERGDE